jgi:hypothetical protein
MGALRTLGAALAALVATQSAALPVSPHERARLFADCAGWLLAVEEHQRIFDGPASEETARRRAEFLDLLDAVLPDAEAQGLPEGTALAWRVTARAEQSALLTRAAFAPDPHARGPALAAAEGRVSVCLGLLPTA